MKPPLPNPLVIDETEIAISGRLIKTARLRGEYYEALEQPEYFIQQFKALSTGAMLFTFLQEIGDQTVRHPYYHEPESLAFLPITTYEQWWKQQINDKTRNMIRKAEKGGVELRVCNLDDAFVCAIMEIYNESPLRQGKPFKHYGKDFATIHREHATYAERSDFIGAFHGDEMIGFIKLVHGKTASSLMQIISKIAWRDKSPTNALIAKAVKICASRGVPYLHYGIWSRRGIGEFKKHHGFIEHQVPRYYAVLDNYGWIALKHGLHRKITSYIPEDALDSLIGLRSRWNQFRYRKILQQTGQ